MEQLADRYAELKGTKVRKSHIEGNRIIFVLENGETLTMSTRQLEDAIAELLTPTAPPPANTPALITGESPVPPKRKDKDT